MAKSAFGQVWAPSVGGEDCRPRRLNSQAGLGFSNVLVTGASRVLSPSLLTPSEGGLPPISQMRKSRGPREAKQGA